MMPEADPGRLAELELELSLASLRSHEKHMRHIYSLRWGGLALSALTITIGAVMVFMGLEGSFDWAVEAPNSIGAKLTNASPGIIFATVGMIIGFFVVIQKPVNYQIGGDNNEEDTLRSELLLLQGKAYPDRIRRQRKSMLGPGSVIGPGTDHN